MSEMLVLISIGPVQKFIAQARRTRDLWFGSQLLSRVSAAACREVLSRGGRIIFPSVIPGELEDLLSSDQGVPMDLPNRILAVVPRTQSFADLSAAIRERAQRPLLEAADGAWRRFADHVIEPAAQDAWHEQVETLLEIVIVGKSLDNDLAECRAILERRLSGRKSLRDFEPWRSQRGDVPKSSLDGGRETVLRERRDSPAFRRLRLSSGEQLDAIGLIKRTGGRPEQFVPLTNIALSSWISTATRLASEPVQALKEELLRLMGQQHEVGQVHRPDLAWAAEFPFDAQCLLQDRVVPFLEESGAIASVANPVEWQDRFIRPLHAECGVPFPYVACLVADGDHIGRILDSLGTEASITRLSDRLRAFATSARQVFSGGEVRGSLVFAGGDDVLAFADLPTCLKCADKLRGAFRDAVGDDDWGQSPTLSIGIGIGHVLEQMGHLIGLGRHALALAKGAHLPNHLRRNALGLVLDKRSGGMTEWRSPWSEDPVETMDRAVSAIKGQFPFGKAQELRSILRQFPTQVKAEESSAWSHVLRWEVRRVLGRAGLGLAEAPGMTPEAVGLDLDEGGNYATNRTRASAWVDMMLVARALSQSSAFPAEEVARA